MRRKKRHPEPWFRQGRGWYLQLGAEQIKLGRDEGEAFSNYHRIMAERAVHKPLPLATPAADVPSVVEVLDKFVTYCQLNKAPDTADWYQKHLKSFLTYLGERQYMPASELCPYHVSDWVDGHHWSPSTRRGRMICVQRAINWAVKGKRVLVNPLAGLEKPAATRRENLVTPDEFNAILTHVHYREAIDLLTVVWETGCRPQEAFRVEARHLQSDRWVFPKEESKGKKRSRVVFLTPTTQAICERLVTLHPSGPLFRNREGERWNAFAVNSLFCRIAQKTKRKVALYDLRHGLATRLLKSGADTITVSAILGHANGDMLSRHYAHVHQDADHLKAALAKS